MEHIKKSGLNPNAEIFYPLPPGLKPAVRRTMSAPVPLEGFTKCWNKECSVMFPRNGERYCSLDCEAVAVCFN